MVMTWSDQMTSVSCIAQFVLQVPSWSQYISRHWHMWFIGTACVSERGCQGPFQIPTDGTWNTAGCTRDKTCLAMGNAGGILQTAPFSMFAC